MRPKFRFWNESLKCWMHPMDCHMNGLGDLEFVVGGKSSKAAPHYKVVFWTGLLDKNGKEIWEGDILKHFLKSSLMNPNGKIAERIAVVEFRGGCFESEFWCGENTAGIEVLGNIYENPELLSRGEATPKDTP